MSDDRYMDEAFELAEAGRGHTHPNPLVGAVLVKDDVAVGRGAHLALGAPHAEAVALAEAGERARGATLYCTLEPCAHRGRTPPCAEALAQAGIARAVLAMRDPNPQVDGRGIARLREAGVRVDLRDDLYGHRARRQNAPFVKYHGTGLPQVTYKAAVTVDGKVAASGGDARWISCLDSRRSVHRLRAQVDAVMVGAGTVRRDDPELTVRLSHGRDPARVVVSRRGELSPDAKVWRAGPRTVVLVQQLRGAAARMLAARQVEVVELGDGGLRAGLRALADMDLLDILCEGGPGLAGSLLHEGLIDRVLLFMAPLVVGRGAPDLFATPAVDAVERAWRVAEPEWRPMCDDIVLSGALVRGDD